MSLKERCLLVERTHKYKLTPPRLSRLYRQNKVSYLVAKKQSGKCFHDAAESHKNRLEFVLTLAQKLIAGEPLLFVDETTTNLTLAPRKIW